ncbi:MAG: imidazole glycerol phosphate synthase subunit HisH [Lachnospiraceae bacterium]|jgi:glutamine amidotransferase|nr:imidazole glycerol phosphate synthase subunit HisH [Lachnospiraceae bacterium]
MIAVIDYGAGNTRSVSNALKALGYEAILTGDGEKIRRADHVILPGVGAFGDAMERLRAVSLDEVIRETVSSGTPFLGICLGQQLLMDSSEESRGVKGLGIIHGTCRRIPEGTGRKVPQIGWNDLSAPAGRQCPGRLFLDVPAHSYVYFVHSYYTVPDDSAVISAVTEYGVTIPASLEQGNVTACQFHPEKSAETGMQILRNFMRADGC